MRTSAVTLRPVLASVRGSWESVERRAFERLALVDPKTVHRETPERLRDDELRE